MDSIIDFMNTNPELFNSYLSIGLSILIIILLVFYWIFWSGNFLFFTPLILLGLCFCIYQSSVGTIRTVFGWILVVLCVLTVLSMLAFYVLAEYGRSFVN